MSVSLFAWQALWVERTMPNSMERITVDPEQCGGRPCIRGMRIRVIDVLDLLAAGLSSEQILAEMPDLDIEDLKAALRYAAHRVDHPVLAT
jgi:uncharacterized protein (DUF433 family)